jgi:hypothetical protein
MNAKRRLLLESLESRQLLAASCVPLSDLAADEEMSPATADRGAEGETILQGETSVIAPDIGFSDPYYVPSFVFGRDLIHQQGNRVFVVDQDGFSTAGHLHVFERTPGGALETIRKIEVSFRVERMIIHDQQIVLIGRQTDLPFPQPRESLEGSDAPRISWRPIPGATLVMTVNLGQDSEVVRQEVVRQEFDANLQILDQSGDRLVVQSRSPRGAVITIFPPPPQSDLLRVFRITPQGLRETASRQVPARGLVAISGDTVLVTHTRYVEIVYLDNELAVEPAGGEPIRAPDDRPLPHYQQTASVVQYKIVENAIQRVAEMELGDGSVHNLHLSSDAQTAIAVRSGDFTNVSGSVVEILDLSGGQIEHFESVRVSGRALAVYDDYVLLSDNDAALIVVDTNKEIDVAAENRIRRIELPAGFLVRPGVLRVDGDRVVLMLERWQERGDSPPPEVPLIAEIPESGIPFRQVFESIVLTVSLRDAAIIGDARLGAETRFAPPYQFTQIDPAKQRFGFFVQNESAAEDRGRRFVFGRLRDDGEFVRDGSIPVGNWLEIDADAERLIVREPDRLLEYGWDNIDDPIITPIAEPPPPVEAVNDQFELIDNGHDRLLDVLANDLTHQNRPYLATHVVELIGAPDGAEIVGGRLVRIPASVLETTDSLRFEYVISDGRTESNAVVEVTIKSFDENVVRELVQRVRRQAAEDFGVPVDEVTITSVERIFDQPLPVVLAGDPRHSLDLSPGILVTLASPNAVALYAASLEGEIIQVFASRRELLVELGLRAVDDRGEPVSQVTEGQEFWIEFTAKDLREFGRGVFAAFFDLVVPTEHIALTGSIEYGDGFQSIRTGSLGDGFVDDIGAVSNQIESPGSGVQQILRIGAKAIAAGEVTLKPEAADAPGTESLIRGRETVVPDHSVRFSSLTLTVVDPPHEDPLDADGNGIISAVDALVIINFLHRFGTTPVAELEDRIARARGEGETLSGDEMASMRRYDTNANGTISTLDALVVINRLSRERLRNTLAESAFAAIGSGLDDDDDDDLAALMS